MPPEENRRVDYLRGRDERKTYAGIFFDLDDTLIEGYMQPPQHYGRVVPLPGRVDMLAELIRAGIKLGIASNQAGVAFGYNTRAQAEQKRIDALAELDLWGRGVPLLMAYYHPDAPTPPDDFYEYRRRKPNPGMLLELAEHFKLSPDDCLFVGDRPEDRQAAENAGMGFCHAESFFADGHGLTLARLNNHARAEAAALAENRRGLLDDQPSRGYTPPRQYGHVFNRETGEWEFITPPGTRPHLRLGPPVIVPIRPPSEFDDQPDSE